MDLWIAFCGNCSEEDNNTCNYAILSMFLPYTCINQFLVVSVDLLLLLSFLYVIISRSFSRNKIAPSNSKHFSPILICSAICNGGLSLAYLGLGIWTIVDKLNAKKAILPLHGWLELLFQGFTWMLINCIVITEKPRLPRITTVKLCSIVTFLFAGFLCFSSFWIAIVDKTASIKGVLDILSFPGATLLLLFSFQESKYVETDPDICHDALYKPLQGEEAIATTENSSNDNVTPFAKARFLSKMSFWWLNRLMKQGKDKILKEIDIPKLRQEDRAQTLYLMLEGQPSKQKHEGKNYSRSMVSEIFFCQRKAILISGLYALIKVLTVSSGPLFLKAFIDVAERKTDFKYEGYVLAGVLFIAKCLESLSERQWFFQTRVIGLQVRSFLSAAIYQKQLRLSNAAKVAHSPGEIMNYVTVDAYRIGEFPYWFHQIWSTSLQLCLALVIVYYSVGLATVAALVVVILTVLATSPVAKLQHKYQTKLMVAQDKRLKSITEALANMKVLKLYAWEKHFNDVIQGLRKEELEWIFAVLLQKGYYLILFWSSPILVSVATFWACYFFEVPLSASNVFTFLASLRIVQEPVRMIPDVAGVFIEAKVSWTRIVKFLEAPELQNRNEWQKCKDKDVEQSLLIKASEISWETNSAKATLRNIDLVAKPGEKVAICGEVGSGKSTLLAAILGEVPNIRGTVSVYGKIAYVSQTAWIQTGSIRENILFGSPMDPHRYQEVLRQCSLIKDLEMLPVGDLTEIGERGVTLSGGQKQRVQLARALYQDADVYLLDDPFSAVDAHTATSLFKEYVMEALSGKTVLLVTHQVDFLPAFNSILFISGGVVPSVSTYDQLLASSQEFQNFVNAHNETVGSQRQAKSATSQQSKTSKGDEIQNKYEEKLVSAPGDQLIKQEERESGNTGLKPYLQYLSQNKGFLYFLLATICHFIFIVGQLIQNYWLASDIQDSNVSTVKLIAVYSGIGAILVLFLLLRALSVVGLGFGASLSIFSTLLSSLFRAPMTFYDSTPLGRILSRVSSDMSVVDIDLAYKLSIALVATMTAYSTYVILAIVTWPVLFVIIPIVYLTILLQRYYLVSAKELMRTDGITKSLLASHLAESIAGAMTIRAFGEQERFFSKNLDLIDTNASANFHGFSANEWLIQRLEIICAIVLSSLALAISLLHFGASASGFIGMALSYGLSLNVHVIASVQSWCLLENLIVSVERLEQYMHIPSEAAEVMEGRRPTHNWPLIGKLEIRDLKVRYRPNAPLVLRGISCIFEGGHKIGIVGRTGSGKTTLISALFRLVEPTEGRIIIDEIDISTIGLHDLRSRLGIIPQDPTLFAGSVRYNLDPLSAHTDQEIWEVLEKCQLREAIREKEEGLDSFVIQDGSNWSMGQRQLFCLGRALLKKSRILVLDEATASIDTATDSILQKTIRKEFAHCTVITVAHRIPTVMDCNMVLAIRDGKIVEYDDPLKLMNKDDSLFGQLVKEYWSHSANASMFSEDL
ncbi:ABC transporter C family member 10-like [Juglans regia]|uniref:ABC-type xenobiotic transporter n=2 Tax=Juglans regia TaxID=51240 RepID=A0A6P9EL50_JUGRE|nr:ABC transporter C family member 10-like [Juglans regia]XP_035543406.1 ABC transporter C family member 10-like [Juglans regia]XP_035543407.1 ABC transporter C family member 10-like [Juglans regia]XP_035543408.1 ABC transporter C family member 10-like [Juglans regia]